MKEITWDFKMDDLQKITYNRPIIAERRQPDQSKYYPPYFELPKGKSTVENSSKKI